MCFIGGKWKAVIRPLAAGNKWYHEWRRLIPAITERALSLHLKQLEEDGLLLRMVLYRKAPLMVAYGLTDSGKS